MKFSVVDDEKKSLSYFKTSVFVHFLGRQLYNFFVPIILLKNGYDVFWVLLFLLFSSFVTIATSYFSEKIMAKKNVMYFNVFAIFSEIILLFLFFKSEFDLTIFFFILLFEGFYYSFYYLSHVAILTYYNNKNETSKNVGDLVIVNAFSIICAVFVGAFLLSNEKSWLLVVSIIVLFLSLIPLIPIVNTTINDKSLSKVPLRNIKKEIFNYGIGAGFEMIFFICWSIYVYLEGFSLYLVGFIPVASAIGKILLSYFLKSKLDFYIVRKITFLITAVGIIFASIYRFIFPEHIIFTNLMFAFLFISFLMGVQTEFINSFKGYQSYFSSKIHSMTTFISRSIVIIVTFIVGLKYIILTPIILVFFFLFVNYKDIKKSIVSYIESSRRVS